MVQIGDERNVEERISLRTWRNLERIAAEAIYHFVGVNIPYKDLYCRYCFCAKEDCACSEMTQNL